MLEHLQGPSIQDGELQKYAESAMAEGTVYHYDCCLSLEKVIKSGEEISMPTSISAGKGRQYLWMVLGSSTPLSSNMHHGVQRVKVIEDEDE
ncbi:hypothetical protein F2Q69_00063554 [Brassica cretica]|uniref:Uncharacterized protein n=1 Tax=Brassica cretica TaxID=69181 RepID=A0A8S9RMU5_BRACR|nr:hypothetical protein F2Q69_00063554 [Brassica cretica]